MFYRRKGHTAVKEGGQLCGLWITWVHDAFTSLTLLALLEINEDQDGGVSDAGLARIVQAQTVWLDDFNDDTYLEVLGQPVDLGRPANGQLK
ncbi:MAG: DUF1007 family protein [Litoreibacter sp.]|nr:DUF1007 family protein [Litoreibacter sp.]